MTTVLERPSGLRGRDFRLLWFGETTSSFGSSVSGVALPLVALSSLHAGVVAVSALSAAAWMPWLVVGLPAGVWVDRLRRRPVLVAADAVALAAFASVPVAAWLGALTMSQLFAVAFAAGVAKVFFSTAYRAYVPTLVPPGELVGANALLQGSESAAQVAGPGLGGLISQLAGAVTGVLLDAVTFAVSLLSLRRIAAREAERPRPHRKVTAEVLEGLHFVVRDDLLRTLTAFGGAANLALTGYSAIAVVFLVRGVGLSAAAAGVCLAVGSLGGVVGALLAPRLVRRFGNARTLLATKVGAAPAGLLIPLAAPGWRVGLFAAGAFVLVGGIVAGNVVSGGFLPTYCPAELFGRVSTSMQLVNFGTIPIGALVGGQLAAAVGLRSALWILFAGLVLASLLLLRGPLRGRRELPTRPAGVS